MYRIVLLLIILTACSEHENPGLTDNTSTNHQAGKKLMEEKCYVCHSPKIAEEQLIAPPMIAIKEAYNFATEKEFTEKFIHFIQQPSKENALMPDAVKKYGVMPYQGYNKEDLALMASYIYNNEIEKPLWWKDNDDNTKNGENDYIKQGKEIAQSTQQALGKVLMEKINQEGTIAAIDYCHLEALPITKNMAEKFNVSSISRLTNKPRNSENLASVEVQQIIEEYQNKIHQNEDISPSIIDQEDKVLFYAPILTQKMCLQCHGNKGETIDLSTYQAISEKYPNDRAIGYAENEVRGVWEIIFEK